MSQPGWYADTTRPGLLRWWDGERWTPHTHPLPRPASRVGELAGFWQRGAALMIDGAISGTATGLLGLPAQIEMQRDLASVQDDFATGTPGSFGDFTDAMAAAYADHVVGLLLLPLLAVLAYHAVLLRWTGATVGKLALGIRVRRVGADERLPWGAIARRVGVQIVVPSVAWGLAFGSGSFGLLAAGWVFGMAYWLTDVLLAARSSRRAGHDLAAGTEVVRTR